MAITNYAGRCLAVASALATAVAFTAVPNSAQAGVSTGAAVGIGLGSLALGSMLGAAASNPYYGYNYPAYGYGYPAYGYSYPAYGYYAPAAGLHLLLVFVPENGHDIRHLQRLQPGLSLRLVAHS